MSTIVVQRVEGLAIAVAAVVGIHASGHPWWWLLALFLAFDLSALPYLWSARQGAFAYNVVHAFALPALLSGYALTQPGQGVQIVAAAWWFHVGVDRVMGYGLKESGRLGDDHLRLEHAAPAE